MLFVAPEPPSAPHRVGTRAPRNWGLWTMDHGQWTFQVREVVMRDASAPPGPQAARSYQGETGSDASRAREDAGAPKSASVLIPGAPASSRAPGPLPFHG